MKKTKIAYWVFTILIAAFMLFSAIPNMMSTAPSIEMVKNHLGYPAYFVPFIGVAKLLGVIALVVPGFPRLKEWAYAGLTFDLVGAMYSSIASGDPVGAALFLLLPIAVLFCSYFFYHKLHSVSLNYAK